MKTEKKVRLVIGKRGSGKSVLVKHMIRNERRLMIYDIMGEYQNGIVFGAEDFVPYLKFWRRFYRSKFRMIYRPIKPLEEIEVISGLVYELGNVCFLVEEIDCYCSTHKISDSLAAIVQRGRHKNITLIGITQRPYGINRLLTSQAKEIYIFSTNEPRDREYLRTLLGQEIEARLDALEQYQYLKWEDGKEGLEIGKA